MKNKLVWITFASNAFLAGIFISLHIWALQTQHEETFIFLAISYGIITIIINTLLIGSKKS